MSGIIPKEQLAAYQRWQFSDFDTPEAALPASTPAEEVAPQEDLPPVDLVETHLPSLPTAEDIARMHDEAREAGYAAGLDEGRQAGEEAARGAFMKAAEQVGALVQNIEGAMAELDQHVADQVLALAIELAGQMARTAMRADGTYLLPIIREAISLLPLHHAQVHILLHPDDASNVREHMGEYLSQQGVRLIDDPTITPGGCKVRAGSSEVDATTEARWKRVLEAIGQEPSAWLKTP